MPHNPHLKDSNDVSKVKFNAIYLVACDSYSYLLDFWNNLWPMKNFITSRQPQDMRLLPVSVENVIDLIPAAVISLLILRDAFVALPSSSQLKGPFYLFRPLAYIRKWITRPFRDFMQMSDMAEYDGRHPVVIKSPQWKKWICVGFSSLAMVGWFSFGTINHLRHGPEHSPKIFELSEYTYSLIIGSSWVRQKFLSILGWKLDDHLL
jgi:hypothetical protein